MTNKLCISFDQTLGPGCREFESRHSDQICGFDRTKSRKVAILCGFFIINKAMEIMV